MKRYLTTAVVLFTLAVSLNVAAYGQPGPDIERERRAQTGMKFLSVSMDARAAAMANAATAVEQASSVSMFYNTASMARMASTFDVALSQVNWIANYRYNGGSAAFAPFDGRYGVFGVTVLAVDYGEVQATVRADNESGYLDVGTVSPSALSAGIGYARALTDRFSVGGNIKYVRQSLGESIMRFDEGGSAVIQENGVSTAAVDFGVLYLTGFRSLTFAASVRNFSRELRYAEENFELPLTFTIGIAMDLLEVAQAGGGNNAFLLSVDAQRPRDYYEQLKIGGEYRFMDLLSLRAGYVFPSDEEGLSLGGGLNVGVGNIDLGADYAYSAFGLLGSVNRLSLHVAF